MKRIKLLLLLLTLSSIIFPKDLLKIGAYTGSFFPNDKRLKEIYNKVEIIYGLKVGVHVWNGFYVWLSGMQYKTFSETTLMGDITRLTLNPLHLSVRYTWKHRLISPYLQVGYTQVYFNEESDIGNKKDKITGYSLSTGIEFELSSRFIIDLGLKYSQAKKKIDIAENIKEEFNLGGFQIGISFLVII